MSGKKQVKVCNWVAAVLMLVLLIMQFVPFWQIAETGETVSISSYVWFPTENKALETSLQEMLGDSNFSVNAIVSAAVLMLVLAAVGLVLCLWKPGVTAVAALPIACGAAGLWGYLTKPVLKLGMGWGWHVALCAVLVVLGAYALYAGLNSQAS